MNKNVYKYTYMLDNVTNHKNALTNTTLASHLSHFFLPFTHNTVKYN